jgi:hypothetical protein
MKRTMANGGERSCEYWQLAKDDLCEAYRNRCVYHKGNAVIPEDHDPTCLQGDALVLAENHDGLLIVVPNPKLSAAEQARLADTVAKLGLNQSAVALALAVPLGRPAALVHRQGAGEGLHRTGRALLQVGDHPAVGGQLALACLLRQQPGFPLFPVALQQARKRQLRCVRRPGTPGDAQDGSAALEQAEVRAEITDEAEMG